MGALDNYSLLFVIFINFFGQLKDWVGQVLFLVSCPNGQVEKYVNVEAWYRLFKNEYGKENYLLKNIPGKYKSAFAKFRCGVEPLKIETGRYEGILTENIICFNNCLSHE